MTLKNPWFLITFEEIERIQKLMRVVHGVLPGTARQNVREIIDFINKVRNRQV